MVLPTSLFDETLLTKTDRFQKAARGDPEMLKNREGRGSIGGVLSCSNRKGEREYLPIRAFYVSTTRGIAVPLP